MKRTFQTNQEFVAAMYQMRAISTLTKWIKQIQSIRSIARYEEHDAVMGGADSSLYEVLVPSTDASLRIIEREVAELSPEDQTIFKPLIDSAWGAYSPTEKAAHLEEDQEFSETVCKKAVSTLSKWLKNLQEIRIIVRHEKHDAIIGGGDPSLYEILLNSTEASLRLMKKRVVELSLENQTIFKPLIESAWDA